MKTATAKKQKDLISPPKMEGGGLECLSIVNEQLGDVIHELEPKIKGGDA